VEKPTVKGARLALESIIEPLASGWSHDDILKNWPGLTPVDILACLGYASAVLHSEKAHQLEPIL